MAARDLAFSILRAPLTWLDRRIDGRQAARDFETAVAWRKQWDADLTALKAENRGPSAFDLDEHGIHRDGRAVALLMATEAGAARIVGCGFTDLDEAAAEHFASLLTEWARNRRIARVQADGGGEL